MSQSVVAWVAFGSSTFLNVILIGALCRIFFFIFQYKKKHRGISKSEKALETNLHCFSYKELQRATNGFQKELGRGSFGVVYERVINIGSAIPIAVKKLNNLLFQQVEKEFKNELHVIGLTHHKNLVRLIGYLWGWSRKIVGLWLHEQWHFGKSSFQKGEMWHPLPITYILIKE